MLDRFAVATALREIGAHMRLERAKTSRFKARAYERAAQALESTQADLEELVREGRLEELPGVGTAIARQIEELAATGASTHLARLRDEAPRRREELAEPEEVDEILLLEAVQAGDRLARHLRAVPGVRAARLAGAARRSQEIVDAVEIAVSAEDPAAVLEAAARWPEIARVDARGTRSLRGRLVSGARFRVGVARPARFGVRLIEMTGSKRHVARLRARAADFARLLAADEAAAYRAVGLPFVPPELREDEGEIEAAENGQPFDLVEIGQIRGLVHCHTVDSDGTATVEEMARAADEMGMEYLTITDHSPTAFYANGLDEDRLKRQWDEIARAQEKVRVRLLRGTEADITSEGAIDWPDRILEQLDVVVASVHARYKMDEAKMTARVLRAMRHPAFKIWGHALGRLLGRRAPFAVRMEEVLDAIAESRAAIEVNGDPYRLDMEPRWIREARARGIPFVVSTDAHSTGALANVAFGVGIARRGWLRAVEVLNTLPGRDFARAVAPFTSR